MAASTARCLGPQLSIMKPNSVLEGEAQNSTSDLMIILFALYFTLQRNHCGRDLDPTSQRGPGATHTGAYRRSGFMPGMPKSAAASAVRYRRSVRR
jgi:hypothetical protein